MKRYLLFLLTCFLFCVSGSLQAQYNIGWSPGASTAFLINGNNGGSYLRATKSASLTFDVSKLSSQAAAAGADFSVLKLDSNGNVLSKITFSDIAAGDNFTVNFEAGEMAAFSLDSGTGTSADSLTGANYSGGTDWKTNDFLINAHLNNFSNWADWWDSQINVSGRAPVEQPSGQPLPGVMATSALALSAFAAMRARKRKK